uniref:Uncharacterized protein n=1 Tax=Rhizophora mucronata TaxID=61149 RepID=A0A2P2NU81_RHIMU
MACHRYSSNNMDELLFLISLCYYQAF